MYTRHKTKTNTTHTHTHASTHARYYINVLQSKLTSTVRLFADDTIAYLTISNNNYKKI